MADEFDASSVTDSDIVSDAGGPIAPIGDVTLVVGVPESRYRVDSRCLSMASKVFKTMFSSNWLEGQNPSSDDPKDVALPDDDPFAIHLICCVVHHRSDLASASLSPQQLLSVAIATDKYDLGVALEYAKTTWLIRPENEKPKMISDGYRLAAAYMFKDHRQFSKISLNLIVEHPGSYMPLYKEEAIREILPHTTFHLLEERRALMRSAIQGIWDNGVYTACQNKTAYHNLIMAPGQGPCAWGQNRKQHYMALLAHYKPCFRLPQVPITYLVDESIRVSLNDMEYLEHPRQDGRGGTVKHPFRTRADTFEWKMERLK